MEKGVVYQTWRASQRPPAARWRRTGSQVVKGFSEESEQNCGGSTGQEQVLVYNLDTESCSSWGGG